MKVSRVRVATTVVGVILVGAVIAVGLHARSVGADLDATRAELQVERRRSSGLQVDVNWACKQHLRMIRGVDVVLSDPARPEVDAATKLDLREIITYESWFAGCKEEYEEMMKFLYGTPEERQQQLDAVADEAEQRRLQFENKRFWIIRDGKKIWIEPDPSSADAGEP